MGTRVDFYVRRGSEAEWLGSYPWDGHPVSVFEDAAEMFDQPLPTEVEWRQWVARYLAENSDGATLPTQGWPWPWDDSRTTDYAYAWDDGVIYGSSFGHGWFKVDPDAEDFGEVYDGDEPKTAVFPNMKDGAKPAPAGSARSGVIVVSFPRAQS